MSLARGNFLISLSGIEEAIKLEPLAQGATQSQLPAGILVLRRGVLIASLISLETFVRQRTAEALRVLEKWPKSFDDLPERLRDAARLEALSNLHGFARLLKRSNEDYHAELRREIGKIASGDGTVQQFSKFIAGDFTGNLSDASMKELLSNLQVKNCWESFRVFASDAGLGVPSVHELVKSIIRKRHRSAHSADYAPTATDIAELKAELLCIGMCFDIAISASMEQSIVTPTDWANGHCQWRDAVDLYTIQATNTALKVFKHGRRTALRVVANVSEGRAVVPRPDPGRVVVLLQQDSSGRPTSWELR